MLRCTLFVVLTTLFLADIWLVETFFFGNNNKNNNKLVEDPDVDYYDILSLPKKDDSTEKDIKRQFRILSKQYHPDHNPTEEAREKYKQIQRAYEVLSDRRKRKVYDMKGAAGVKTYEQAGQGHQGGGGIMDFFGGFQQQASGTRRGENMEVLLQVSLEDIYKGATHKIRMPKQKVCKECKGSGAASRGDLAKCDRCAGQGMIVQEYQLGPGIIQRAQQHCPKCAGRGVSIKKKCPHCHGQKVSRSMSYLEVDIERGMRENEKIVFDMEGDQSPEVLPGDVIVRIASAPHSVYKRKSNQVDLTMTMQITLKQSLLGFKRSVTHLDGTEFVVEKNTVTGHLEEMKLRGKGMPRHQVPSESGDLIITFEVVYPTHKPLTVEQRQKFRELLQ